MAFGGLLTLGSLVEKGPDQRVEGELVAGRQARHWDVPRAECQVPVWSRTCWADAAPIVISLRLGTENSAPDSARRWE